MKDIKFKEAGCQRPSGEAACKAGRGREKSVPGRAAACVTSPRLTDHIQELNEVQCGHRQWPRGECKRWPAGEAGLPLNPPTPTPSTALKAKASS